MLCLTKYGYLGASSRIRTYQYLPFLRRAGAEVVASAFFSDEQLREFYNRQRRAKVGLLRSIVIRVYQLIILKRYDIVWVEKELIPYFPFFFELIFKIRKIPYAVDYDDAIFHNYDKSEYWVVRRLLGKKIDRVMRNAAFVSVGSAYLEARAIHAGAQQVVRLPSVVSAEAYVDASGGVSRKFAIGWVGSPATQHYLESIAAPLAHVQRLTDCDVVVIGATQSVQEALPDVRLTILPWDERVEKDLGRYFDIGIMPLPDDAWAKGKCSYKIVQYMACGLPVVVSNTGENINVLEFSRAGYLVETAEEWQEALLALFSSSDNRNTLGSRGRLAVENRYCLEVQAPNLINVLRQHASYK